MALVYANLATIPMARQESEPERTTMITKRVFLSGMLTTGIGQAAVRHAQAQAYPARTIKIIVPFLPGATSDAMARLIADKLTHALGPPVIVENRAGGPGGSIGTSAVAAADPDGY